MCEKFLKRSTIRTKYKTNFSEENTKAILELFIV